MKRIAISIAVLSISLPATPQVADSPVEWNAQAIKRAEPLTYELRFTGRIAEGYIVYASDFSIDVGPRPTRIRLADDVNARGTLQSSGTHSKKDPAFNGEYRYFEGTAQLSQQVLVKDGVTHARGTLVGQTCREADGTCSLFSQKFEIALP
jgi:thiol:disulfide interchange protein DsbD